MPLSVYTSYNRPPSDWDHTLAHPHGLTTVAGFNVTVGMVLPFIGVGALPWLLLAPLTALHILGGAFIALGIYGADSDLVRARSARGMERVKEQIKLFLSPVGSSDVTRSWVRERVGLGLIILAWAAWLVILVDEPGSIVTILFAAWTIIGNALRIQAINTREREIKKAAGKD